MTPSVPDLAREELVYPQLLDEAADHCTHASAFTDDRLSLCLCRLRERAARLATGLARLDPTPAPFAVLSRNRVDYVTAWLVAMTGHRVLTPLNARLAVPELEHVLRDSGARVMVVEHAFAAQAVELARLVPGLVLVTVDDGPLEDAPHLAVDSLVGLVERSAPGAAVTTREPDVVTIMYTGGTTGAPKGVVLTQRAVVLGLYRQGIAYETFTHRDRWLMTTPMFHASSFAGLFAVAVAHGEVFVPEGFDPDSFVADVERHGITACVLVPTMMQLVVDSAAYRPERLATLRLIGYGGSPIPEDLMSTLVRDLPGCDLRQIYGSTEIGGIATLLGSDDHRAGGEVLRSAGYSMPGIRLQVQDGEGHVSPAHAVGEICIRTGSLMSGYHNAPEQTREAFRDGWYRSGDAGYLDATGRLFVVDRLKDMIVTGGENVYSAEVENALASHEGIAQVAVIGIPHRVWGEAVHAVVVPAQGHKLIQGAVIAHARSRLAGYKTPKSVEFRDRLPVSAANKVLKHVLRDEAKHLGRQGPTGRDLDDQDRNEGNNR
jgi:acyl-CoA synthetase (AMP-forming)/AMP-acid ligase II